jgi:hypothetical protein
MSSVSDLFDLENQVGPYEGPRLGNAPEVDLDGPDFVYSPGYSGPLRNRAAALDRPGGVNQLGGRRQRQRQQKRQRRTRQRLSKKQRSTRRRFH